MTRSLTTLIALLAIVCCPITIAGAQDRLPIDDADNKEGEDLRVQANNPGDQEVTNDQQDVIIGEWSLTMGATNGPLSEIVFAAAGDGNDVDDLARVRLQMETKANEELGQEQNLDEIEGSYDSDDGSVRFAIDGRWELPAAQAVTMRLIYDMGSDLVNDTTFSARMTDITLMIDIVLNVQGLPSDSSTLTVNNPELPSELIISDRNPANRIITVPAGNQVVAVIDALASGDNVWLDSVTLTAAGTGDDENALSAVAVAIDEDRDGVYTVGVDTITDSLGYNVDNGSLTLFVQANINDGQSLRVLVLYSFNSLAAPGATFTASVTDVVATAGANFQVTGLPMAGATLTVLDPDGVLSCSAANPASGEISDNAIRIVGGLDMLASIKDVTISDVTITANTDMNLSSDVVSVSLIHDVNGDGSYQPGTDTLLDTQAFTAGNTVTLGTGSLLIAQDTTARLIVEVQFGSGLVPGHIFGFTFDSATALANATVTGLPSGSATVSVLLPSLGSASGGCQVGGSMSGAGWLLLLIIGGLVAIRRVR